jgi:hypothetical protein
MDLYSGHTYGKNKMQEEKSVIQWASRKEKAEKEIRGRE